MKIGLYFGSFNPVHTGHCIIASHVLNNTDLKQVWFVISPQNPFKISGSLLNEYHRFHLVQTAIQGEINLKASDIEFQLPKPSYTANTLTYLTEKFPQHSFSIIMGSDSFQNLSRWNNAKFIINNYEIFVYMRPEFPVQNSIGAKLVLLDAPLLEISATFIRENIKQKKSIRYLVPDNVREEIEKNGYYKT